VSPTPQSTEIEALVVDWDLLRLRARLAPGQRILGGLQAQAFAMVALRGTWRRRFPELSPSELNMKVLAYLTPVRMDRS
jgi:hypothetical protein